jgi:hypothetical protein
MLTVDEAFVKFKGRLELTQREQDDASRRQRRIREVIAHEFEVVRDFLTGSYARHTKTKPLKDVDIFTVLGKNEEHYLDEGPGRILEAFRDVLAREYGAHRVEIQRRSVRVDFGVTPVNDRSDQVMSFDVTPACPKGAHYVIPDRTTNDWMQTNPEVHARKATAANEGFDGKWKPLVKMIKKWNDHNDKPIKPSFLIEVMSLELLDRWAGSYPRELQGWFATASREIDRTWPDPAGLGHPVSDRMEREPWLRETAKQALRDAERSCREALNEERQGRTGNALDIWQGLFGPAFSKS